MLRNPSVDSVFMYTTKVQSQPYRLGYCALRDQINRARPGLMAVRLGHAHVDRQAGAARKGDRVFDHEPPAPVGFRQTIDAQLAAEAAAVEGNFAIGKLREVDLA